MGRAKWSWAKVVQVRMRKRTRRAIKATNSFPGPTQTCEAKNGMAPDDEKWCQAECQVIKTQLYFRSTRTEDVNEFTETAMCLEFTVLSQSSHYLSIVIGGIRTWHLSQHRAPISPPTKSLQMHSGHAHMPFIRLKQGLTCWIDCILLLPMRLLRDLCVSWKNFYRTLLVGFS